MQCVAVCVAVSVLITHHFPASAGGGVLRLSTLFGIFLELYFGLFLFFFSLTLRHRDIEILRLSARKIARENGLMSARKEEERE